MQLDAPFVRLPFVVDTAALDAEVAALAPSSGRRHPEGAPGNTAVPLIAYQGDPEDDRAKGVMAPTPYLTQLPIVRRLLGSLDSVISRTRLMRIEEEGRSSPRRMVFRNCYWRDRLRVHFPVSAAPDVRLSATVSSPHGRRRSLRCSTPGGRSSRRGNRRARRARHLGSSTRIGRRDCRRRIGPPTPSRSSFTVDDPETTLVTDA